MLQSGCVPVSNHTATSASDRIARAFLLDCAMAHARLVCVGERGAIALSDDNGEHWRRAQAPPTRLLTAVDFADARRGWAVGHDGVILHSDDGGATWRVQYRLADDSVPLFDVSFSGAHLGIAVGAFGGYVTTDDGGVTWTERRIAASDSHLYAIARASNGALIIAGEASTLLRSDDNGANWRSIASPIEGSVFGVVTGADNFVLAYGLLGAWARSHDAGNTWQTGQLPTRASIQAADISDPNAPLLGSADGSVWRFDGEPLARDVGAVTHLQRLSDGDVLLTGISGAKRLSLSASTEPASLAR